MNNATQDVLHGPHTQPPPPQKKIQSLHVILSGLTNTKDRFESMIRVV
jgi:hypothetical protein